MPHVPQRFQFSAKPVADRRAVVVEGNARFTVLTSRCIRMEWSSSGAFEDRPSQTFWFRKQPVPAFKTRRNGELTITTDHLVLHYQPDANGFTAESLAVRIRTTKAEWRPGTVDQANLGGTARTLDGVQGPRALEPGLMSRTGLAVVDDTNSLVFNEHCWPERRPHDQGAYSDLYLFGYGADYQGCLRDFCALAGNIPLIPRWALGNWWSRYWAYSDRELLDLMGEFRARAIPLSVCIIDMDWHIVKNRYTGGWTGYTWDPTYFPEPKEFLKRLRGEFGLKASLNLHPADGVHAHEDAYPRMARHMGIDPRTKKPVAFDIADPHFVEGYFKHLHHPQERIGIDFWWMDWQQGTQSKLTGLDPLYLLNHLHFYDLARDGRHRPFIFSRFAGLGSHRYQIGFSGDTIVSWESLEFQPYFTLTASNVGYTWWSHDIGGHFWGAEDPELFARWVQLGVFSPILRLHASKNSFQLRYPWENGAGPFHAIREAMQLRHALVPYIYSMNRLTHDESVPLIRPMYWLDPDHEEAYHCPRQYWFGTELVVAPFVKPADTTTRLSRQVVWLPNGDWYDFRTGAYYRGGGYHAIYGRLEDVPVFARAGAIVPLSGDQPVNGTPNPEHLRVRVFAGADNRFGLYEDDGESSSFENGACCTTPIAVHGTGNRVTVTVGAPSGDTRVLPRRRQWTIELVNVVEPRSVELTAGGRRLKAANAYDSRTGCLTITAPSLPAGTSLRLTAAAKGSIITRNDSQRSDRLHQAMRFFDLPNQRKASIWERLTEKNFDPRALREHATAFTPAQARCVCELLFEAGMELVQPSDNQSRRILVWNNARRRDVTMYAYKALIHRHLPAVPVPQSSVIGFDGGWGEEWKFTSGHPWHCAIDYAGVYRVVAEGLV